jgi:hypothetical protein
VGRKERLINEIAAIVEDPDLDYRVKVVLRNSALILRDMESASATIEEVRKQHTLSERAETLLQELGHVLAHSAQWPAETEIG